MVLLAGDRQFPILCVLVQVDRWAGVLRWSSVFATSDSFYRCCNRGEVTDGHGGSCLVVGRIQNRHRNRHRASQAIKINRRKKTASQ
jgi:hypothetical protein